MRPIRVKKMPRSCDVRKNDSGGKCDRPHLDVFSIGHSMFGLVAGSIYLLFFYLVYANSGFSQAVFYSGIILSFIVSLAIFLAWDLLEHSIVKEKIYIEKWGQKGWCETRLNIVSDITFAFISFQIVFLPSIILARSWMDVLTLMIVLQVSAFLLTFYLSKKGYIKKGKRVQKE